jgi:hypothetical protein
MNIKTRWVPGTIPDCFDVYEDDKLIMHQWMNADGHWFEIEAGTVGTPRRMATHAGLKGHAEYLAQQTKGVTP